MRCETSFFSLTLYKKHLQRYWPMWAVWLAGWLLAMPVQLWNESRWYERATLLREASQLAGVLPATSNVVAAAAPVVAVAVFFHLFRSPAANFAGALPMRREGLFATAFAGGYTILAAPLAVTALVTALVEWSVQATDGKALLTWLGGSLLLCFFWFSFAVLCCVISGSAVAAVCFYGIFNGVVAVMGFLVQAVLAEFLYGFNSFGRGTWDILHWLTPIFMTSQNDNYIVQTLGLSGRMEMLLMYAAVGFLMLLAALGLHHIRKAERAGDLIAFVPIRWLFRVSVTLCGGLSLGMLLTVIIFNSTAALQNGALLAGCCAVAAAISWFVAEMLLQKSFKVFKDHWKGALIGALCFVVAIFAIDMDWIGFTTRVPQPSQVKAAQAEIHGSGVDPVALDGLAYDGETVKALIELHQYLVDNRDGNGDRFAHVEVEYDLGLASMKRVYNFNYRSGSQAAQRLQAAIQSGQPFFDISQAPLSAFFTCEGEEGTSSRELSLSELDAVWTAVQEDVSAGRYRMEKGLSDYNGSYLELRFDDGLHNFRWQQFFLREGTTSTNAAVERLKLRETVKKPEKPVETALAQKS